MRGKKAYIFLLDAVFAVMILVIGFMIISSTKPKHVQDVPLALISDNILELLSSVKIGELCDGCSCTDDVLSNYCSSGMIRNNETTVLDYFGELYYRKATDDDIKKIFLSMTGSFMRQDLYMTELIIDGHPVYAAPGRRTSPDLITGKRIIFGYIENKVTGNVEFWGPYIIEVNVWK